MVRLLLSSALLLVAALPLLAEKALLFSFFRNNGEDGLYLATSPDGYRWQPLHGDKPLLRPEIGESKLMRDPSILQGPDGTYHLVWTTSWNGKTMGYARSKDLKQWSAQKELRPFAEGTPVLNCWAPELYYDKKSKEFWIIWASTIAGTFPETLGKGTRDYNHRLYAMRTKDFVTFSAATVFYEPGFQVIDGAVFPYAGGVAMIAKNETQNPPAKYLFLATAPRPAGPWSKPGPSLSGPEWAEGPAPIQYRGMWLIYFDKYRDKRWGLLGGKDLQHLRDLSDQLQMPAGARHGTAFLADEKHVAALAAR